MFLEDSEGDFEALEVVGISFTEHWVGARFLPAIHRSRGIAPGWTWDFSELWRRVLWLGDVVKC